MSAVYSLFFHERSLKGVAMNSLFSKLGMSAAIVSAMLIPMQGQAASDTATSAAEAQQLVENFTPEAQYRLSRREAYAAYNEALQRCRQSGGAERTACMRDAKSQLRDDLAYAKAQRQGDTSVGSSGTAGTSASGTATSSTSAQR
jgi:hypothetical protein